MMLWLFFVLLFSLHLLTSADFLPETALRQANFSLFDESDDVVILATEGIGAAVTGSYLDALAGAYQIVRVNGSSGQIRTSPYDDLLGINDTTQGLSDLVYDWSVDLSGQGLNFECLSAHPISGKIYAISQHAADASQMYFYGNKLTNYTVVEVDLISATSTKLFTVQTNFFQYSTGNGGITDCTFSPDGQMYFWAHATFSGQSDDVFFVDFDNHQFVPLYSGSPNGQTNTMFFYPRINSLVHQYGARFDSLNSDKSWYYGYNSNSFVYDRYSSAYFPTEFDYSTDKGQGLWRLSASMEWYDQDSFVTVASRREDFSYLHPDTARSNTFCEQSHLIQQRLKTETNQTESDNSIEGLWAPFGSNGCNVGAVTVLRKPQLFFDSNQISDDILTVTYVPECQNCSQETEIWIDVVSVSDSWSVNTINNVSFPTVLTVAGSQDFVLKQQCQLFFDWGQTETIELLFQHSLFSWSVNYTVDFNTSGCSCDSSHCLLNENTTLMCDSDGSNKQCSDCLEGWTGPDCATDIDIPILECPLNVTAFTDLNQNYSSEVTWGPLQEAWDNNDILIVNSTVQNGSDFYFGSNKVIYILSDGFHTVNCSFYVFVLDQEIPTVSCPQDILTTTKTDQNHSDLIVFPDAQISDNVAVREMIVSENNNQTFFYGLNVVTVTVFDVSNNQNNCSFLIEVKDLQRPEIICPETVTINSTQTDYLPADPVVWDNVAVDSFELSNDTYNFGTNNVSYVVFDSAGNNQTCFFNIKVIDTELPVLICPENVELFITENVTYVDNITLPVPFTSDNVQTDKLVVVNEQDKYEYGDTEIIYRLNDTSGNEQNCSFILTVSDMYPPTIFCPEDQTVETDLDKDYISEGNFNFSAPKTSDNIAVGVLNYNGSSRYYFGTNVITYTVKDLDANQVSCSFLLHVQDVQIPTINCPADLEVATDLGKNTSSAVVYSLDDNYWDNVKVENIFDPYQGGYSTDFVLGQTPVEITIQDSSGNQNSCTFTVIIFDDENPEIVCPASISKENDFAQNGAVVFYDLPIVTENTNVYTIESNYNSGDFFEIGSNEVIYTVVDSGNNQANCSFFVVIIDTERPTALCPENVEIGTDDFVAVENISWTGHSCLDNSGICFGTFSVFDQQIFVGNNVFDLGTTKITYTVTDENNNTDSCEFTLEVINVCENFYCFEYIDPCYVIHDQCVAVGTQAYCDWTPRAAGTPCVQNNTYVCNGIGECVFYSEVNSTCNQNNQLSTAYLIEPNFILLFVLLIVLF